MHYNHLLTTGYNKLYVDKHVPFEDSIFIDTDCILVDAISFLFDLLKNKESEYLKFSKNVISDDNEKKIKVLKTKEFKVQFAPSF